MRAKGSHIIESAKNIADGKETKRRCRRNKLKQLDVDKATERICKIVNLEG